MENKYVVYEKIPAHGSIENGVILGYYNTKEEAEIDRMKYGYSSDNYYVDKYTHENGKIK